jgi:hypothetical protein
MPLRARNWSALASLVANSRLHLVCRQRTVRLAVLLYASGIGWFAIQTVCKFDYRAMPLPITRKRQKLLISQIRMEKRPRKP